MSAEMSAKHWIMCIHAQQAHVLQQIKELRIDILFKRNYPPKVPCQVQGSLSIWIQESVLVLVWLFATASEHKGRFQQIMPTYKKLVSNYHIIQQSYWK